MSQREPLPEEQREAALRNIRGPDRGDIVEAAKLLSADSSTTARLLELLASEEHVEVRQGILYALTWHGDVSLWDLMIRILSDQKEHPKVRGQAAECISYLFEKIETDSKEFKAAVDALQEALKDDSPEVRYCAVNALGSTKYLPIVPVLQGMLRDQTPVEGWLGSVGDEASRAIEWIKRGNSQPPDGIPIGREPADVLDAIRAEVHAGSGGKLFSLLIELELGLCRYDKFPEDAFERYTSLLADPAFWMHEDTWQFVKEVGDSWNLLSSSQRETLRPLLVAHFDKGFNPMGAFVIGELLGGRYGDRAALDALVKLAGVASLPARAFVPHGLGVLARETRNGELRKRAVLVLRHLEKSEIEQVRSEASLALGKIGDGGG
ncbi:HEAT repeat domain-containing protein [Archangium violaceum]|uniref:HEAT repeat domain-containing protein n=1 Tax=Archangium violaceum TaxID=83451 RepID=UPI00194E4F3E|nr:HEAT repeat domain-containing protein [Archangium violaceum]QRN93602.1 HEAT repeat domain-containing protein [Archangium violaceum]